jgi:hypothetical protein
MAIIEIAKIQVRRGQENQTGVPQLDPGEFGWAQDTENLYIGKRIVEGAISDANTRILTENDLVSFLSLANNTGTELTSYRYRNSVYYITDTTTSTVQKKLDSLSPSLTDFGVEPSGTPTDITLFFRNAVETIYKNPYGTYARQEARRKIKIPAGNFYISNVIELPPYAIIEGESKELTKLTLINSATNIFKTIDAYGNDFDSGLMESGANRSRGVTIKNLTLEYDPVLGSSDNALISIDNCLDSTIENCSFKTAFDTTSTTTFGLVSAGVGVEIRGIGGGLGSGDTNLCENVSVRDSEFNGLYIGVRSTGTVINTKIDNNKFENLNRGVELTKGTLESGPQNNYIRSNRFESIVGEAVFVGTNTNEAIHSSHSVSDNYFVQVGNGLGLDDLITTSTFATPIVRFYSHGNRCVNNTFYRKILAENTGTTSTFYYAPLVSGNAIISDTAVNTATIVGGSTSVITKIPYTGKDQMVNMRYQLTKGGLSRKGTVIFNIAPDGFPGVFDLYSYIEDLPDGVEEGPEIYFDVDPSDIPGRNSISLIMVNTATTVLLQYQIDIMVS